MITICRASTAGQEGEEIGAIHLEEWTECHEDEETGIFFDRK
jgi:hypothetical protein